MLLRESTAEIADRSFGDRLAALVSLIFKNSGFSSMSEAEAAAYLKKSGMGTCCLSSSLKYLTKQSSLQQ